MTTTINFPKSLTEDGQANASVLMGEISKYTEGSATILSIDVLADPIEIVSDVPLEPEVLWHIEHLILPAHKGGAHIFEIEDPDIQVLREQVKGIAGYSHISSEGNKVTIWFDSQLSASNLSTLQAIGADPVPLAKFLKNEKIDDVTKALIKVGFVYGGDLFSFSENAQINISNLPTIAAGESPGPIDWATKDNGKIIELADATEIMAFYTVAMTHKAGHLATGNVLKKAVIAAADLSAVGDVADNR